MSLHCKACSSTFFPEEIEDTQKELPEDNDRYRPDALKERNEKSIR